MKRGLTVIALGLGLLPATFTHTTLHKFDVPRFAPKLVLPAPPVSMARRVERALRFWITPVPVADAASAVVESAEDIPSRDIASFRPKFPEPTGIPDLPEGKPVTDTRFDFWLSYKFQF